MKFINRLVAVLFTISAFSTAVFAARFWEVAGTWQLVERTCSDGTQPTDEFQLGRDEITLTIVKHLLDHFGWVDAKVRIDNQYYTSGGYTLFDGMMKFRNVKGAPEVIPYRLSVTDELILETSGFGEGGSCKVGQVLSSRFHRN